MKVTLKNSTTTALSNKAAKNNLTRLTAAGSARLLAMVNAKVPTVQQINVANAAVSPLLSIWLCN
jgi:hypothetical protein